MAHDHGHGGGDHNHGDDHGGGHHHILPEKTILLIGGTLLFFTAVTVWVAGIDLGKFNFVVAMLVATFKATLVALWFMALKYDRKENAVIFGASFLFLAIFISFTGIDLFYRGDVYVKGSVTNAFGSTASAKSKFKKPWVSTPELMAHGKTQFVAQCTSCHGAEGKGDGPAAAALNPRPRNFTAGDGWKQGRKPSEVYKTISGGVAGSGMPSFASLPPDDRWALTHYVLSLGPAGPADSAADLAKVGVDPNKETAGGGEEEKSIPVELAMERMIDPGMGSAPPGSHSAAPAGGAGAGVYQARCLECHGQAGEGGVRVSNLGVQPQAFLDTRPFLTGTQSLRSPEQFSALLNRGLPGGGMPSFGQLSNSEVRDLYQYVRALAAAR